MDLLDDIFDDGASKPVKAGGKFQPKVKPRLVKKGPAAASSVVPLQSKSSGDVAATESTEAVRVEKPSQNYDEQSSVLAEPSLEPPVEVETVSPPICSNPDASMVKPDYSEDWKFCIEKSVGENADIYIGLDSFDDLLPHSSATEPSAVNVAGTETGQERPAIPVSSVDDSTADTSNLHPDEVAAAQDPLTSQGSVIPISASCVMEMGSCPSSEADVFGVTNKSGQSIGRFQPKPKLQVYRERCDASVPESNIGESVSCQPDSQLVHSETDFMNKGKEYEFPAADVLDFSAGGFNSNIVRESTSEFPVDEDYVMEASHSDAGIPAEHPEASSQMPEEHAPQKPKTKKQKLSASNRSQFGEENGTGRSLRSRRKTVNATRLVDESEEEEVLDDGEDVPKHPNDSVTNGSDDNDEDFQVENESQGKKVQKKSKKTVGEEGKRVRKSKKTTEASGQADNKKPKKFSHSTRQKRRRVDKTLLETSVDEIDYQKVPLKDLILLAEHKERLAKKEASVSQVPTTEQSAGTSFQDYDQDEIYAPDEGEELNDQQISPRAQDSGYFNYQTYMDKTPSTRWSKQDTELFYEAVQQFGTDLSLIQQLFPGRTRRQLKHKYKKEERQHPFRLHDALTSRRKDHSHFEKVIERLKQIEAEEREKADKDESTDLTAEEDAEGAQVINEEDAKSEHIEEIEVEAAEQDVPEMQSPVKEDDSEDDWLRWSQYKSEV